MLLSQLRESAGLRYIVVTNSGDGPDFTVVKTVDEVVDTLNDTSYDYAEVFSYSGEILGMGISGHGETVFTTSGSNRCVFSKMDGDIETDDLHIEDRLE